MMQGINGGVESETSSFTDIDIVHPSQMMTPTPTHLCNQQHVQQENTHIFRASLDWLLLTVCQNPEAFRKWLGENVGILSVTIPTVANEDEWKKMKDIYFHCVEIVLINLIWPYKVT